MRHFGKISLKKILPNLPQEERDQVQKLLDKGWTCGFYLGVYGEKMMLSLAAQKGRRQHIVVAPESAQVVKQLCAQIAAQPTEGIRE